MNERLAHRFELLTSREGDRNWDKSGRHRSLWAAIAWSHDLLPPDLRRFFVRLSVFRGGCTPEAAAAVCGEPEALERLTQLRERSLVMSEEAGAGMRFRLLESLREFGDEHAADDERAALARGHAAHFLGQAEETYPLLFGPASAKWLDGLESDHENLRRALDWWLAAPDGEGVDGGLRLSAALWRFWAVRGYYAEGRAWLHRALAREGGTPALRAKAANAGGNLARAQGDYAEAERLFQAALTTMRGLDHPVAVGSLLCNLGMVAMHRGEYPKAVGLYEESLALRRGAGDQAGMAFSLQCLGIVARHQGEYDRARAFFGQSRALWGRAGGRGGPDVGAGQPGGRRPRNGRRRRGPPPLPRSPAPGAGPGGSGSADVLRWPPSAEWPCAAGMQIGRRPCWGLPAHCWPAPAYSLPRRTPPIWRRCSRTSGPPCRAQSPARPGRRGRR